MSDALNVTSIHRHLRAARYTQKHCEGATSDVVDIRDGSTSITINYEDFKALAEGILKQPVGPALSEADF